MMYHATERIASGWIKWLDRATFGALKTCCHLASDRSISSFFSDAPFKGS